VRKNEIDIQKIPIVMITEQYIEYIDLIKALNLDLAGEFIVMAATLMYLKSRTLLPKTDDDETEEPTTLEDLKKQLMEHQKYRDAAERLKEQNILEKNVFSRSNFPEPVSSVDENDIQEASLFDLLSALKKVIDRSKDKGTIMELNLEHISVKDKINELLQKVGGHTDGLPFEELFSDAPTKILIITTFLAMLELIKMQAIKVYQNKSFSSIYVYPVGDEEVTGETQTDE
jgi:segregation and condensation protein A